MMNKSTNLVLSALFVAIISCSSPQNQQENANTYDTTGSIERLDPELNEYVPEAARIEVLASGFTWTEGPVWSTELQSLLFSDIPNNAIYQWNESDSISLFLQPSGFTGDLPGKEGWELGSNGLMIDKDGALILCQHGDRRLARMNAPITEPQPDFTTLAGTYEGVPFNSPNDLVMSTSGAVFFTDPPYGLRDAYLKELDFQGVYKLGESGMLSLQIDSLTRPNGIGLSPDEKTLYVAVSDPQRARYYAYDLDNNQDVISGKVLLDVTNLVGDERPGLPDGLKVHSSGTLFATGPGGVYLISPEGRHLGTILTGQHTANCAFNADESILYLTADMHIMRIRL